MPRLKLNLAPLEPALSRGLAHLLNLVDRVMERHAVKPKRRRKRIAESARVVENRNPVEYRPTA
jgi:hypothetical protein